MTNSVSSDIASGASADANNDGIPDECGAVHVRAGANAGGNGVTWQTALNSLADALAYVDSLPCSTTYEVWVATGTYTPATTFPLKSGVSVYGGFAGNETERNQRNPAVNVTVLSGDIQGNDGAGILSDNAGTVVTAWGCDSTAVLDGFTIRGGYTSPFNLTWEGAGIYCLLGGPMIANCVITGNTAADGGGMYCGGSSPTIVNCAFSGNRATFEKGGGLYIASGQPTLVNCVFSGNEALGLGGSGAGMWSSGQPTLTNCTFSGNRSSSEPAGIYMGAGSLTNCILWENLATIPVNEGDQIVAVGGGPSVNYTCIQGLTGTFEGEGNTAADPLFVSAVNGDFRLLPNSLSIDAGDSPAVVSSTLTDLDGNPRFVDDPAAPNTGIPLDDSNCRVVDRGAYELGSSPTVAVEAVGCRYLKVTPAPGAAPVALRVRGDCDNSLVGCVSAYVQNPLPGSAPVFSAATVHSTIVSKTPGQWGTVYVADSELIPLATYSIATEGGVASAGSSATLWTWADTTRGSGIGVVDLDDILCVLDAFANIYTIPGCTKYSADIACVPNRVVDLDDIISVLDAFEGLQFTTLCPNPPCSNLLLEMSAGGGDPESGGELPPTATGTLRFARNPSTGGRHLVAVDVFLSGTSELLRGYQLSLEAVAGPQGHGRLELDDFVIDPERTDYVYRNQIPQGASPGPPYVYTSVDRVEGRIAVALPQGGATVAGESYVGTVVLRREAGAGGRFHVRHRPEHTLLRDSAHRAIEVFDDGGADIELNGAP